MTMLKKSVLSLACLMAAAAAQAGQGHIYSIQPWATGLSPAPVASDECPVSSPEQPLVGGDTVRFVLRMAPAKNYEGEPNSNKWYSAFVGVGSEAMAKINNPFRIGIFVSGELREAVLENEYHYSSSVAYSDFVFKYTVRPGDFALPIVLAMKDGSPATGEFLADTAYYINPLCDGDWSVRNAKGDKANFWFGSHLAGEGESVQDYDLRKAGFHAKTVDFDSKYEVEPDTTVIPATEGVWRSVHEGSTETTTLDPTLVLAAAATNSVTLHIWSDNGAAVVVSGDGAHDVVMTTGYSGGKALLATNKVLDVKIQAGQTSIPFDICGVASNKTAHLVLSANTNYTYNSSDMRYTDYVTVPVRCVESLPANVKATAVLPETDDELADPIPVSNGWERVVGRIRVLPSAGYTNDLTVTVTPKLLKDASNAWSNYIHVADAKTPGSWSSLTPCTLTFTASDIANEKPRYVYLYAMGAGECTAPSTGGIQFEVALDEEGAEYYKKVTSDSIVYFQTTQPVIVSPAEGASLDANGNVSREFEIKVSDSYRNMNDRANGYTVYYIPDSGATTKWTALAGKWGADENGILCKIGADGSLLTDLPAWTYTSEGTYETAVKVIAPDGKPTSETRTFTVTVTPPATAGVVTDLNKSNTTNEGESAAIYVQLSQRNRTGDTIYAFLEPQTANASNLVQATCLTSSTDSEGLPIYPDEDVSDVGTLLFLDGAAQKKGGTSLRYKVVLCTDYTYDKAKLVEGFQGKYVTLKALNVEPKLNSVSMDVVTTVYNDGETMSDTVSKGVEKTFTFDVEEPGQKDLEATGDDSFQLRWAIREYSGASTNAILKGNANTNSFKYAFKSTGLATVTVELMDKDMKDYNGKFGPKFTFYVNVTDLPRVSIASESGSFNFREDRTGPLHTKMYVRLTKNSAQENLDFAVVVTPKFDATDNPGTLTLDCGTQQTTNRNVYFVTFVPGQTEAEFNVSEADGTKLTGSRGYSLQAKCATTTTNPDGQPWSSVFISESPVILTLQNSTPEIETDLGAENGTTNAFPAAVGYYEQPIGYMVSDVDLDLGKVGSTTNLTVSWYSEGLGLQSTNVCSATNTYYYTPKFNTSGNGKKVYVTVTDKDGGKVTKTWYFDVETSKTLVSYPVGPAGSGTTIAKRYSVLPGSGEGHIWISGASFKSEELFQQKWNCGLSGNVYAYAWGYKVGAVDNGTLNSSSTYQYDIPVDANGGNTVGAKALSSYYGYGDKVRDSFLYLWVKNTVENGANSESYGMIAPEAWNGTAASRPDVYQPALPTEPDQSGNYPDTLIEAVFSKEYLPSDNMGDINFDGVPDLFVQKYGFGVFDATTGEITGDDRASLRDYNDDLDFLPGGKSAIYDYFVTSPRTALTQVGTPFTAPMEIRGAYAPTNAAYAKAELGVDQIWSGLNDAADDLTYGVKGVSNETCYAAFGTNVRATLTELEYEAWCMAGKPEKWSPERPTDPTKWDSDADNLSDGYEYYFWYRAHVGYLSGGVHAFLTGRRYNPTNPNEYFEISSAEIEAVMDPQTFYDHDLDTDGDGLSNFEESACGTDPFDYDTDGDGLPDGYEVMVLGTDALAKDDSMENPDGDLMAAVPMTMRRVGFLSEDGTRVDWMCYDILPGMTNQVYADGEERTGWIFKTGDAKGTVTNAYVTRASFATGKNAAGEDVLVSDLVRGTVWELSGDATKGYYLGAPAFVARGTRILAAPEEQTYRTKVSNSQPAKWYRAWRYRDGDPTADEYARWIRAGASDPKGTPGYFAFSNRVVVAEEVKDDKMQVLHYNAYQATGFNPNYGWSGTRAFKHIDEFMTLAYFVQDGCLPEIAYSDVTNDTLKAWGDYTTNPKSCDTDRDGTPDGWELYVMVGPQKYNDKGELVYPAENGQARRTAFPIEKSPYGPFVNGATTDADADGLDWANEFSGTKSSAVYDPTETAAAANYYPDGVEATIACRRTEWRNKTRATDPWNADTDGDGLKDGEEGTYFLYGASGKAGGGLDPTSWDTDLDGLPDPFEAEFAGTWQGGVVSESSTTSVDESGATNTTTSTSASAVTWNDDGMDGTVSDSMKDYDHDGLLNWQEYMVGAMRHFRYDDPVSQWSRQTATLGAIPETGTDEWNEYWSKMLLDDHSYEAGSANLDYNPNLIGVAVPALGIAFDPASAYFSYCTNEWDSAKGRWYMFRDGIYHDLKTPPADKYWSDGLGIPVGQHKGAYQFNRYTWIPAMAASWNMGPTFDCEYEGHALIYPRKYICCNPAKADTDNDGMDDYYELFHGLNPLLGASGVNSKFSGGDVPCDIVFEAYQDIEEHNPFSAENNYFLNTDTCHPFQAVRVQPGSASAQESIKYDFAAFPWLAGLAVADPDGDDIRNQKEAILPNMQAAATYLHTDPTPLWMTDTSDGNSFANRYYNFQPFTDVENLVLALVGTKVEPTFVYHNPWTGADETHSFEEFPGFTWNKTTGYLEFVFDNNNWDVEKYVYSFEENEGYDSDHDNLNDSEETEGRTKGASDPQDHDSPLRRQAMWFNGTDALLETTAAVGDYPATEESLSEAREAYLYFTVECWAKADAAMLANDSVIHTLVERSLYTGESGPADSSYVRKNFQLGIFNGRWYVGYDSSGTKSPANARFEISEKQMASTNWTHVAATYDGATLRLYVNGVCTVEKDVGREPEHGMAAAGTTDTAVIDGHDITWQTAAFLVGGSAKTFYAHYVDAVYRFGLLTPMPTAANGDYGGFFKGYIDEVRVWDGARDGSAILADVENRTRYTAETALANRKDVYKDWLLGARRTTASTLKLPAQLMHHWAFDHIPGAVDVADVATVPSGFGSSLKKVTDAKAYWVRPEGWSCPWWKTAAPRSSVYADAAWVPWLCDTVGHLPRFDLTTDDSVYWSENYAGATPATTTAMGTFAFPRTAEVYSRWYQMSYPENGTGSDEAPRTTPTRWLLVKDDDSLKNAYIFATRGRNTQGDDLLPLGGAFPRRLSLSDGGMWDAKEGEAATAADAWSQTGPDSNNDGLPDWWSQYALENYYDGDPTKGSVTWNTVVDYHGTEMAAWEAYRRDLARGMHRENGRIVVVDAAYADTLDLDGDGMWDWWEDMCGINTGSKADATADPDHDGLSNYKEFKITEIDGLYQLSPKLSHSVSGAGVVDYFLQITNAALATYGQYLGEVYADHDFMEDDAEDDAGLDRTRYDAWSDADEDGWSAFSEMRYSNFKMGIAQRFLSHLVGEEEMKDFPIPVVHATLRYNGDRAMSTSNATIVVQAYSGNRVQKEPNAVYSIQPGRTETRTQILGAYTDQTIHGTLTPGNVIAGADKVSLEILFVQPDDLFAWTIGTNANNSFTGNYSEMYAAYVANKETFALASQELSWAKLTSNGTITYTDGTDNALAVSLDANSQTGHFLLMGERAGEIDFTTGDFTLNLAAIGDITIEGTAVALSQCFFRLGYSSKMPTLQTQALSVSLATPDTGRLTEGKTAFSAYLDIDGDGYTPAKDPIGCVTDVDVGWDKVPELVIEMTDSSLAAGRRFATPATNATLRIVRTGVNGSTDGVSPRIVYSATLGDTSRGYVFEGDHVTSGKYGLDWENLRSDLQAMENLNLRDVTAVDYTVVLGEGSIQNINSNDVVTTFSVEYSPEAVKPACVSPSEKADGTVETQRPVFKWTAADDYTCFRLQVRDETAQTTLYESPVAALPARDASGRYCWEAPLYIGTNVLGRAADRWVLDNHRTYKWRVAMYNAKFSATEEGASAWSDWATMRTALADSNDFSTKYGTVKVSVRYFGPATNGLRDVIVQLYRTADLSGTPAAKTRLFDVKGGVTNLAAAARTVAFHGLAAGDYYACAFVDRNGDGERQRYEIWGYAAQVGKNLSEIWRPVSVTADWSSAKIPSVAVYMEDTDVNGDDILDWSQDESVLKDATSTTTASSDADSDVDSDDDGLTDYEELYKSYTKSSNWDTDGDGMPDGWEYKFAKTDPNKADDGSYVVAGDVMAYMEVKRDVIRVQSTLTGTEGIYVVPEGMATPQVGDVMNNKKLQTCYYYGKDQVFLATSLFGVGADAAVPTSAAYKMATVSNDLTAARGNFIFAKDAVIDVGTNVCGMTAWTIAGKESGGYILGPATNFSAEATAESGTNTIVKLQGIVSVSLGENRVVEVLKDATVALVHAQVYDAAGFNPKTAVAVSDAVNTKPFTALDKYLVARYLDALGLGDEKAMNKAGALYGSNKLPIGTSPWAQQTLKPGDSDNDKDGLADGWELYVMFGPGAKIAEKALISPWNYDDARMRSPGDGTMLENECTVLQEYGMGADGLPHPTDPWAGDTDGDSVSDYFYHTYHLWDPTGDPDGDGLSSYAEYLITEVFAFATCDPDTYATQDPSTGKAWCDYYKKVGELYLGEMFMDHDRVSDVWERTYPAAANASVYDPERDDDQDGWSNWAEAQAGTDPTTAGSVDYDSYLIPQYPVPVVKAKVVYNGRQLMLDNLYVKAWNDKLDGEMTGSPDAIWKISSLVSSSTSDDDETQATASAADNVKALGLKPDKARTYNLGIGTVSQGSFAAYFKNASYVEGSVTDGKFEVTGLSASSEASWYKGVYDNNGKLYATQDQSEVGTIDYASGNVTIDFAADALSGAMIGSAGNIESGDSSNVTSNSTGTAVLFDLETAHVKLAWQSTTAQMNLGGTYYLSDSLVPSTALPSFGHVREGKTSFIAYIGDSTGAYVPGNPFGVVRGVDVGWAGASFTIELSDTSAITPRFNLWDSATNDRGVSIDATYAWMAKLTDRLDPDNTASNQVQGANAQNAKARVRFVRFGVNDTYAYRLGVGTVCERTDGPYDPLLFERWYDKNGRDFICEADFLKDGEFDIDWNDLKEKVCDWPEVEKGVGDVTNMTYLAVLDGGMGNEYWLSGSSDTNTIIKCAETTIVRRFEGTKHAPVARNVSGICYAARPTFQWTLPNEEAYAKEFGTTYTAFKLKIFDSDGTKIYDSGVRRAPAQDESGVFSWTADASAGDLVSAGHVLAATGNYSWQVAMYNAKFKPHASDATWYKDEPSASADFSLAVNGQQEMNDHGYSSVDVSVKYAGPSSVLTDYATVWTTNNKVRVQAFETADFAGDPASETIVQSAVDVFDDASANVRLVGLPAAGTYYVRAYVDSNGNHKLDDWESWGAAAEPVKLTSATAPLAKVWIEDSDTDGDWLPDAYEYATYGGLTSASGNLVLNSQADVLSGGQTIFSSSAFNAATSRQASISTYLEGASLTIFENGSWAKTMLGWGANDAITFDMIREAIQQGLTVDSDSFKITSMALTGNVLTLAVDADVSSASVGSELLSRVYTVEKEKTVTLRILKKDSLAQENWEQVGKDLTVTLGTDTQTATVVLEDKLDSAFYKVEIVGE